MACPKNSFLSFLHVVHVFTVNYIQLCKTHFLKIYKISYKRYTYLSSWSDYPSLLPNRKLADRIISMLKVRVAALRPDQCAVETKSDLRCSADMLARLCITHNRSIDAVIWQVRLQGYRFGFFGCQYVTKMSSTVCEHESAHHGHDKGHSVCLFVVVVFIFFVKNYIIFVCCFFL